MKINRRNFFAVLLAPFLPKPKIDMAHWTEDGEPSDIGELDDTTLTALNGIPAFADYSILPTWSGEIFPTYGSLKRNGTLGAGAASKDSE